MRYTDEVERIMQSDIYFFITSVAVVVITLVLVVVLIEIYRLVRTLRKVAHHVEDEIGNARGVLGMIREKIAEAPGLGFLSHKPAKQKSRRRTVKKTVD